MNVKIVNAPTPPVDRKEVILRNVRENARCQVDAAHRENYFRSCEAHGGDLAEVVAAVRKEM